MQPPKPITEQLIDNQAILWDIWKRKRQTEKPSAELLQIEENAYRLHKLLIKKAKKINKMNTPLLPRVRSRRLKTKLEQFA